MAVLFTFAAARLENFEVPSTEESHLFWFLKALLLSASYAELSKCIITPRVKLAFHSHTDGIVHALIDLSHRLCDLGDSSWYRRILGLSAQAIASE